jgi:hypothetical protein
VIDCQAIANIRRQGKNEEKTLPDVWLPDPPNQQTDTPLTKNKITEK